MLRGRKRNLNLLQSLVFNTTKITDAHLSYHIGDNIAVGEKMRLPFLEQIISRTSCHIWQISIFYLEAQTKGDISKQTSEFVKAGVTLQFAEDEKGICS